MTLLEEMLEEIKDLSVDEQIKQVCDTIADEEEVNTDHPDMLPVGPNIFLAIEVPSRLKSENSLAFVTLERETPGNYIIRTWESRLSASSLKVVTSEDVKFSDPKRIMKTYATKVKFMKGVKS